MKNLKLANIIDFIFINLLFFLISFVWIKYFSKDILLSIVIALSFLIIFNLIRFFIKNKKSINNTISKKLEEDINQYSLTFLSNTTKENLDFFAKVIKNKEPTVDFKKNLILYKSNDILTALCPIFNEKEIIAEKCLKYISYAKELKIHILCFLCCNTSLKTNSFLSGFKDIEIKILDKKQIFNQLLKPTGIYPEIKFNFKENKKLKLKELINISFNKSRAKGYFLSGLFIFFCSFVVRYNFYYVFMSSILFLFTIFCYLKKEEKTANSLFF
ncbi:MAG: hypothetical protein IJW32_01770 [Clostridia bacterium]|nr:hypothetical protein [Clostridia bacterium]